MKAEWQNCGFGGDLHVCFYKRIDATTVLVEGFYTVYTPYDEHEVQFSFDIDNCPSAPTEEQVRENLEWWLEDHRELWEDSWADEEEE